MKISKSFLVALILLSLALFRAPAVTGYPPHQGDYFNYHEVQSVANGTGSYSGYTDQTTVDGVENMNGVSGSTVSANYSYSLKFSDSQGSSTTSSVSGTYTWSDSTFLYLSGTDNEQGYTNPTVWFAMNNALHVGATFLILDTEMTVKSTNYTFYLPTESKNVNTIFAQGNGSYIGSPGDNAYGNFNAKYTWNEYFDLSTGYIVGYTYVEQDVSPNGNGTGFGYADDLYVTSTSYPLSTVGGEFTTTTNSSPLVTITTSQAIVAPSNSSGGGLNQYVGYILLVVLVIAVISILVAFSRRKAKLPEHSVPPPQQQPPSVDLTPNQLPQQIVIRDVAKVNCKYCGTLIDSTAEVCPRCGAHRT